MAKKFEEFYTDKETLDMDRFESLGVIKNEPLYDEKRLNNFEHAIDQIKLSSNWDKKLILNEKTPLCPF